MMASGNSLRFRPPPDRTTMFCFGSRSPVAEFVPEEDSLMFIRPGFLQLRSSRGCLFYLPAPQTSPQPTSAQFFRNRVPRPTSLCIASVGTDEGVRRLSSYADHKARLLSRTLARSRESAKRFLRLSLSQHSSQSFTIPGAAQSQAEVTAGSGSVEDMVSADGERHSPVRRNRGTSSVGGPLSGMVHRPALVEELRAASVQTTSNDNFAPVSALCDEKPIASGNGLSISISLAEPVLYLQGFDQNDSTSGSTAMLRGSLHLHVTKQAKLKTISLSFRGRSDTEWPEGIPPRRIEFRDTEIIMNHTWPFFNAQFPQAEHSYCADVVHLAKGPLISTKEVGVTASSFDLFQRTASPRPNPNHREANRLSLQLNQSRSFGKGETINGGPTIAQKGFKVFHPGDYVYNFELPVDSRLPESINVELGNVKYELEALVERSGAFRANLMGTKQLTMIRAPAEGSLEQIEPIAISRNWEDQLHYDIVISGKSFPLGASVPIAFKLTPLAKVQCHRIKVFVTENIQYFTANKRVHRLEPTRKVQLFEKRADAPSTSAYPGSTMRVTAGGGIAWDHREAAARGEENVSRDQTNLLGNLDYDSASIGPTEMEFNVKLPSCHQMKDRPKSERLHFDTTYQNIQVNHWIKVRSLHCPVILSHL
jgi:arrestin-related trafficking adapter 3/6